MIKEAIILAGGIGSRLQSVVNDRPKCMALVNQKPFISYLIAYLVGQGIEKIIFSLGFKYQMVEEFLKRNYSNLNYLAVVEPEPLGTGGAIQLALKSATEKDVLICNGDTFFKADVSELSAFHSLLDAECTIALKPMIQFDRFGAVELDGNSKVRLFREKQFRESGLINGGVYVIKRETFLDEQLPEKFSFEQNYLEKKVSEQGQIFGCIQDVFFIDIGIPEDYARAQNEKELIALNP